ncbi:hypothetical protein F503_02572 [Ophiostoma piceae UAMH 11346]|uniref:Uncharacterized protein n=1 Tax=Ophiostoma piceae (strain UAMH 11346) TaxID=1262450 RepID=S3BYU2_OPHP1|nr:hypothetical protein F503_02572 [Ophiostoma piceae UAMH 11346]
MASPFLENSSMEGLHIFSNVELHINPACLIVSRPDDEESRASSSRNDSIRPLPPQHPFVTENPNQTIESLSETYGEVETDEWILFLEAYGLKQNDVDPEEAGRAADATNILRSPEYLFDHADGITTAFNRLGNATECYEWDDQEDLSVDKEKDADPRTNTSTITDTSTAVDGSDICRTAPVSVLALVHTAERGDSIRQSMREVEVARLTGSSVDTDALGNIVTGIAPGTSTGEITNTRPNMRYGTAVVVGDGTGYDTDTNVMVRTGDSTVSSNTGTTATTTDANAAVGLMTSTSTGSRAGTTNAGSKTRIKQKRDRRKYKDNFRYHIQKQPRKPPLR